MSVEKLLTDTKETWRDLYINDLVCHNVTATGSISFSSIVTPEITAGTGTFINLFSTNTNVQSITGGTATFNVLRAQEITGANAYFDNAIIQNVTIFTGSIIDLQTTIIYSTGAILDFLNVGTTATIGTLVASTGIISDTLTVTNGPVTITSATGYYQIDGIATSSIETLDTIPSPFFSNQVDNTFNPGAGNTGYFGAIMKINNPCSYNKIVFRAAGTAIASDTRISIYQRFGGVSANASNPAVLISTTSTGPVSANTTVTLPMTGINKLSPGIAYLFYGRTGSGGGVYTTYTTTGFDVLNRNMSTGAPVNFSSTTTTDTIPSTLDPTSQIPNTGNTFLICRLVA